MRVASNSTGEHNQSPLLLGRLRGQAYYMYVTPALQNKLTHHRQGNWHVLCCSPKVKKAYRHMYQVQLWFDNGQTSSFTGDFENNYSHCGNCHSNNKSSLKSSKMTKTMCYTSWYWTSSFPSFWSLIKNCLFLYMPSQISDLNRLPVNGMDWNN